MRLFVALDIPENVRRTISELMQKLEPTCLGARWVRAEGMHVTLKFIGEASEEKVAAVRKELSAVHSAQAAELGFRNVGFFPNARHPRVFWVGIETSPNLAEMAGEIERRLEKLGIPREDRAFKPHLTLARFKSEEGLPRLHDAIQKLGAVEFGRMSTEEFYLYQSTLKPGGAEYTKLETFAFTKIVSASSRFRESAK